LSRRGGREKDDQRGGLDRTHVDYMTPPPAPVVIFRRESGPSSVRRAPAARATAAGLAAGRLAGAAGAQRPPLIFVGKVFDGQVGACVRSRLMRAWTAPGDPWRVRSGRRPERLRTVGPLGLADSGMSLHPGVRRPSDDPMFNLFAERSPGRRDGTGGNRIRIPTAGYPAAHD
jgi:hypothetical protein